MPPQPLGTIFASSAELDAMDAHAHRQDLARQEIERRTFPDITPRLVGGERRYYRGPFYAIIGRDNAARYFESMIEGDYPTTRQQWEGGKQT